VSKKYKGKVCVYCSKELATTSDHVFAREFFLVKHRDGLPQAPACNRCNGEKAKIEHYLTTVIPFGGLHRDASAILRTMVPKRLERNSKLRRHLERGFTGEKIPLEPGQIERLFAFISKGLLWHHWRTVLEVDDGVAVTMIQAAGVAVINNTLARLKPKDHIYADLGEGTFIYEGIQTIDSPRSTFWRFLMYGGACFADSSRDPDGRNSLILAVTGPKSLMPQSWTQVC
jgi:hypothetical protein